MKTLWNILAFLAVVNLLAIGIGTGWLWWSGRIDSARVDSMRSMLARPIAEVRAAEAEDDLRQRAAQAAATEERRWGQIPVSSVRAIDEAERWSDLGRSMQGRLEGQAQALAAGIKARAAARTASLDAREAAIAERETALNLRLDAQHDADFAVMVASVSALRDSEALAILLGYINDHREPLVVTVLAALDEDRRTDLIGEFVKANQAELAGRLLLAMRERGREASGTSETAFAARRPASSRPGTDGDDSRP